MANPVLSNNPNFKTGGGLSGNPFEVTRAITVESVLQKALISFVLLVATAVVGWAIASPILMIGASVAALVLVIINAFRRGKPSRILTLGYAGLEGLALGTLSVFYDNQYPGIVLQAVIGTFSVLAVSLALFRFAGFRATARASRIFFVALLGYVVYSFVNVILVVTGVVHDPYGLDGSVTLFGIPLGIILGLFAVVMGAYFLIEDFTLVENAVQRRADDSFGWTAVLGIMVTLVFIYVQILRILGLARR